MARIRTVKPGLFRHETLQDLESANPNLRPMLVFIGLFTQADRDGRFEWRPKQLKLDILPFVEFDMTDTLELLRANDFIRKYQVAGKSYGFIPTWADHQCPNVKEPASKIPAPFQNSASTVPTRGEVELEVEGKKERIVEPEEFDPSDVIEAIHEAHPKPERSHRTLVAIMAAAEESSKRLKCGKDEALEYLRGRADTYGRLKNGYWVGECKFFADQIYRQSDEVWAAESGVKPKPDQSWMVGTGPAVCKVAGWEDR